MGEVPSQNAGTVLPVENLTVESESRSPVSYSSFIVTIGLSRLVSDIFACNTQTDGGTTQTITIAGRPAKNLERVNRYNSAARKKAKNIYYLTIIVNLAKI